MIPQMNSFSSLAGYGNYTSPSGQVLDPNYFQNLVANGGIPNATGAVSPGMAEPSFMQGLTGYKNTDGTQVAGWGAPALAAGQGLFNAWMGMKQYGLYKDQLNESKRQFGLNFDAQRQTTNASLEDRQRARVASNPGAYQSVGDYMTANGIRG